MKALKANSILQGFIMSRRPAPLHSRSLSGASVAVAACALLLASVGAADARRPSRTTQSPRYEAPKYSQYKRPPYLDTAAVSAAAATLAYGAAVVLPSGKAAYRVRPELLIPGELLSKSTEWYLSRAVSLKNITFASYIHESRPDAQRVRQAAGDRLQIIHNEASLKDLISSHNSKMIVIVGHSKDGYLIQESLIHGRIVEVGRIDLREIQQYATSNGVGLYLLTCRGANQTGVSGVSGDLWTPEVVERIKRVSHAETYGQFFAALGSKENPTVIQGIDASRIGEALEYTISTLTPIGERFIEVNGREQTVPPRARHSEQSDSEESHNVIGWLIVIGIIAVIFASSRTPGKHARGPIELEFLDLGSVTGWAHQLERAFKRLGLDDDSASILMSKGSAAGPMRDKIFRTINDHKLGIIDDTKAKKDLFFLAESLRPFPSRLQLGLSESEYATLATLHLGKQPENLYRELLLLLVERRQHTGDSTALAETFVSLATRAASTESIFSFDFTRKVWTVSVRLNDLS